MTNPERIGELTQMLRQWTGGAPAEFLAELGHKTRDWPAEFKELADAVGKVAGQATEAESARLREMVRQRPLTAIALAIASGVFIASVLRR